MTTMSYNINLYSVDTPLNLNMSNLVMTTMSYNINLYSVDTLLNLNISNLVQQLAPNQDDDISDSDGYASDAETVKYDSNGDQIPDLIDWVE
jgi:hypothetical protein